MDIHWELERTEKKNWKMFLRRDILAWFEILCGSFFRIFLFFRISKTLLCCGGREKRRERRRIFRIFIFLPRVSYTMEATTTRFINFSSVEGWFPSRCVGDDDALLCELALLSSEWASYLSWDDVFHPPSKKLLYYTSQCAVWKRVEHLQLISRINFEI